MKFPTFIARKIAIDRSKSFTRVIIGIAVAAVALSMAIMILTIATISGFKREINSKIFGFWGHIHITDTNITKDFELRAIDVDLPYYDSLKTIDHVDYQVPWSLFGFELKNKYKSVRSKGGIEHIQPIIIIPGILETDENFHTILFKGVNEEFAWEKMQRFMKEGQALSATSSQSDIVISASVASTLKLKVGDDVIAAFAKGSNKVRRKLKVNGIYNTGLEEYDKRFIIGNMGLIQQILEWDSDQAAGIEIFLDNIEDMDVITDYIYNSVIPLNFYSETIQEKFPSLFDWLKLQDVNEQVILALMGVVGIVNMITVFLILILERSRMIGLLKALGATNRQVKLIFIYYAAIIIILGQIIGNLVGLGLAAIQKKTGILKLDEQNYYLDTVPIYFEWGSFILINVIALVVTLVCLIVPATFISKVSPIKALRFD